jgi:hypothetical protein
VTVPVTLTRPQFAQTRAAAKPGATYGRYLAYIAAHRGDGGAPAPSAGTSLQDLMALATKLYGKPMTDPQMSASAQRTVMGQINPLVANITAQIGNQSRLAQAGIRGTSEAYARDVAGIPASVHADYRQAEGSQAAVGDALTNFLTQQGAGRQADLSGRLSAINAPAESHALGDVNTAGLASGVAAASLAKGSAGLDTLLGNEGNHAAFADTIPGLVALAGLHNSRLSESQYQAELAKQTGDLQAQVPTLAGNQLGQLRTQAANQQAGILHLANSLNDAAIKQQIAGQTSADRRYGVDVRAKTSAASIAAANSRAAAARDAAWARAQLTHSAAGSGKAQKAVAHAFDKAAADAAKMYAGTYGSAGSPLSSIFAGTSSAGPRWDFRKAYNAVFAGVEADTRTYLDAAGVRRVTLRALARGGYPVTVTKGG